MTSVTRRLWCAVLCVLCAGRVAAQTDAIDLARVEFHLAPEHVKGWPITTTISKIELSSRDGVGVTLIGKERWPDYTPAGWDGPINWALWLIVRCQGRWHGAAVIEYWNGGSSPKYWTGAPLLTHYADWIYPNPGSPWGAMGSCAPKRGDSVGFMAAPVSHRMNKAHESVSERSNVVTVTIVEDAVFEFPTVGTPPQPPTVPPVTPPTVPDATLTARVEALERRLSEVVSGLLEQVRILAESMTTIDAWSGTVNGRLDALAGGLAVLEARVLGISCEARLVPGVGLSCRIKVPAQ